MRLKLKALENKSLVEIFRSINERPWHAYNSSLDSLVGASHSYSGWGWSDWWNGRKIELRCSTAMECWGNKTEAGQPVKLSLIAFYRPQKIFHDDFPTTTSVIALTVKGSLLVVVRLERHMELSLSVSVRPFSGPMYPPWPKR